MCCFNGEIGKNQIKMRGKGLNIRNMITSKKKNYIVGTVTGSTSGPSRLTSLTLTLAIGKNFNTTCFVSLTRLLR